MEQLIFAPDPKLITRHGEDLNRKTVGNSCHGVTISRPKGSINKIVVYPLNVELRPTSTS